MHLVAGAGVCARYRKQRHLLALEDVVRALDLRTLRGHHAKLRIGQLVANIDRHRSSPQLCGWFLNRAGEACNITSAAAATAPEGSASTGRRARWLRPPRPSFRRAVAAAVSFRRWSSADRS